MNRLVFRVRLVAIALLLSGWSASVSAQSVQLEFHDGLVNLTTQNASTRAILAEWARLGGTQVVNAERLSGAPVTLQLNNVPETQALDIILRGNAGYIAGLRETSTAATRSGLDRILIIPTAGTSVPAPAPRPVVVQPPFGTAPRPPFAATPPPPPQRDPDDDPVSDVPPDDEPPVRNVPANGRRGGQAPAQPFQPQDDDGTQPAPDTPPPDAPSPNTPAPNNPFGIRTGSSQPGTISPVPQPQTPRPPQRDQEP